MFTFTNSLLQSSFFVAGPGQSVVHGTIKDVNKDLMQLRLNDISPAQSRLQEPTGDQLDQPLSLASMLISSV
jgi:hypothetical protein